MSLYDFKALFTSVPVEPALNIIWDKLQSDTTLHNRNPPSTRNNMSLLEFCLKSTIFTFQGKYYKQVQGAAMGSPVSPMVANLFIEDFKAGALSSSPNPPGSGSGLWMTHSLSKKTEHTQQFLSHLTSFEPQIQCTVETPDQHGSLPFLDTLVSQAPSGTLITTVYRKPTHTDQYLHWDSHHSIINKYSVCNTLSHRAQYVCSKQ